MKSAFFSPVGFGREIGAGAMQEQGRGDLIAPARRRAILTVVIQRVGVAAGKGEVTHAVGGGVLVIGLVIRKLRHPDLALGRAPISSSGNHARRFGF